MNHILEAVGVTLSGFEMLELQALAVSKRNLKTFVRRARGIARDVLKFARELYQNDPAPYGNRAEVLRRKAADVSTIIASASRMVRKRRKQHHRVYRYHRDP